MRKTGIFFLIFSFLFLFCDTPAGAGGIEKIHRAPAEKIVDFILKQPGRKVIFIYASWCTYCRKNIPAMIDIEKAKPGSVFAVSVDSRPQALGAYLSQYPEVPFDALMMQDNRSNAIENAFGVPARRGVPYKILLDENNAVYQSGNFNTDYIAKYVLGE